MMIDLNHGSGLVYGAPRRAAGDLPTRVNALIDARWSRATAASARATISAAAASASPAPASSSTNSPTRRRIPAPTSTARSCGCSTPATQFEALSIRWLREAGFDLRDQRRRWRQFGFSAAGGRLRGHIDGVIVAGPDVGVRWPALWEHKALNAKSWADLVKRGLRLSKPIYFAQVQLYMAYMELEVGAVHRAEQGHARRSTTRSCPSSRPRPRHSPTRPSTILRAAEAGELPPRIAASPGLLSLPLVRLRRSAAGRARHELHPIAAAGSRHRRDRGLVSAPHAHEQQVFRLFGYAGTGKTTITRHAIEALGLDADGPRRRLPAACCSPPSPARRRW